MDLRLRNGTHYLKKRVPKAYASVEAREDVWVSLKADSLRAAQEKRDEVWGGVAAVWKARLVATQRMRRRVTQLPSR